MISYNSEQIAAINATEPYTYITAPAGAGKTSTLIGAIQQYKAAHPSDTIVAITFTRKAAQELEERLHDPSIYTGTIHAWSLRQLYSFSKRYHFQVKLMEETEMRAMMKDLAMRAGFFYININQLYLWITGAIKTIDIDEQIVQMYNRVALAYVREKEKLGKYDFMDLPNYLLDIMNEYQIGIDNVDALFVDEIQDVDLVQYQVFDRVNAKRKMYIGDQKQAIYGFRGSLSDIMDRLDNFKHYKLRLNYRSLQNIIDTAIATRASIIGTLDSGATNTFLLGNVWSCGNDEIQCARGEGGSVYIMESERCIEGVGSTYSPDRTDYKDLLQKFFSADSMILCRTNREVRKLQAMGISNCTTIHQAKGLEYENVIVCDFLIEDAEGVNVAYVAMTRAKNRLLLTNVPNLMNAIRKYGINTDGEPTKLLF